MTERERMLAGELYDCGDPELLAQWHKAKDLVRDYNQTNSAQADEKERILDVYKRQASSFLNTEMYNFMIQRKNYAVYVVAISKKDYNKHDFFRAESGPDRSRHELRRSKKQYG